MLGENIKKIRLNKKLGLNKTAEKAEISGSYLSDIENGKKENPTIATLTKIADALEVPLDYLTRKSAKAIIEDKMEDLNITLEELSKKTNTPKAFFNRLDFIIPDEGDYQKIKLIAHTLNIEPSKLIRALSRQEPTISRNEKYIDINDEFEMIKNYSKDGKKNINLDDPSDEISSNQKDISPIALKLSKLNTEDLELIDNLLTRLLNEKKEN